MEELSSIMHWYAFKVFYNKVFEIEDSLNKDKIESYIPCERILVERGGVKKHVRKPIISSLLFFHSTEKQALALQQKLTDRVLLYTRLVNWQKQPIAIPEREMKIFISRSGIAIGCFCQLTRRVYRRTRSVSFCCKASACFSVEWKNRREEMIGLRTCFFTPPRSTRILSQGI